MAVSLKKNDKINLSKEVEGLKSIYIGLGWDEAKPEKKGLFGLFSSDTVEDIDCDASVIMLKDGKFKSNEDLVYYHNLEHVSGSVVSMGDNRTGGGDGDDEQIRVNLDKVPKKYDSMIVIVNIYEAFSRKQHFGMIKNAYCHIMDTKNNKELCRFDLTEDYSGKTGITVGRLYRSENDEWQFEALGIGSKPHAISDMVAEYR